MSSKISKSWVPVDAVESETVAKVGSRSRSVASRTEVRSVDDYPITSFKMMQKATKIRASASVSGAGFAVGAASFDGLEYRYLAALFSDRYDVITGSDGEKRFKRFGFGLGVTLTVREVDADLKVSFGSLSAASAMNFAKVSYRIEIYGIKDASVLGHLPPETGDFSFEIYKEIIACVTRIKTYIAENPAIVDLYPVDVLSPDPSPLAGGGTSSFYFGAREVAVGNSLKKALERAENNPLYEEDPRIIQYMYRYFGMSNAFVEPTLTQQGRARRWIQGKYNLMADGPKVGDVWISVDGAKERETGRLLTLSHLGDDYKPHDLPGDWLERGWKSHDGHEMVSVSSSTQLAIAAIADVSGEFDSVTIVRDIAIYWDVYDDTGGSEVIQTRYGIGVRMQLRLRNIEFGVDVSYAAIGAASELGYANVDVEVSGIGISDKSILADLPAPQDVSQASLEQIESAVGKILDRITAAGTDLSGFSPQPFMIQVRDAEQVDPTLSHQAVVYAHVQIRDRVRRKNALSRATSLGLSTEEIEEVYDDVGLTKEKEDKRPSREQSRDARAWLEIRG